MTKLTKVEIEELMEKSEGGYSRDNYSNAAWRGAIKFLHSQDFDHEAIVETLLSKWMRWGHDYLWGREGKIPTGKNTADFLKENLDYIKEMLCDELGYPKGKARRSA